MSIISFAHHKGGTGKTTSCLNIAGFLQKASNRVLVVDVDPQANATAGLGIRPKSVRMSMYDVFMSVFDGSPRVEIRDVVVNTQSGVDLAPSNLELVGAEPYLYTIENRASVLKDALALISPSYDFILIDTPPSMGQFVINGLVASDRTIVTFDRGVFALHGLQTLMTVFDDIEEIIGETIDAEMAVLTRWPEEKRAGLFSFLSLKGRADTEERESLRGIESEVRRYFRHVFSVPYDREIYDAQLAGMPISHFSPDSAAGLAYEQITKVVQTWK
ncbi:MAG: AAA family ATPase [Methanoregulaceae archaeon]|nr:AAA family ATPase [Methanoregulaceae archaeon]